MSDERLEELHLRRLLVALDGSESGRLALRAAVTAALRDNAAITLLCVAVDAAKSAGGFAAVAGAPPPDQTRLDAVAEETLAESVRLVPAEIPVRKLLRRGHAGPEIVAAARESDYDAILLGARGLGRIGALIGSVSSYVMHNAEIPVFVAHAVRGVEKSAG
ncbi:MAG: universal stress protein [Solirubrobacterales bacterium]